MYPKMYIFKRIIFSPHQTITLNPPKPKSLHTYTTQKLLSCYGTKGHYFYFQSSNWNLFLARIIQWNLQFLCSFKKPTQNCSFLEKGIFTLLYFVLKCKHQSFNTVAAFWNWVFKFRNIFYILSHLKEFRTMYVLILKLLCKM